MDQAPPTFLPFLFVFSKETSRMKKSGYPTVFAALLPGGWKMSKLSAVVWFQGSFPVFFVFPGFTLFYAIYATLAIFYKV
jgi:hypothetical protein